MPTRIGNRFNGFPVTSWRVPRRAEARLGEFVVAVANPALKRGVAVQTEPVRRSQRLKTNAPFERDRRNRTFMRGLKMIEDHCHTEGPQTPPAMALPNGGGN